MSRNLKLEILLKAVDKVTAPLKEMNAGTNATAKSIASARKELKGLEAAQKNISTFRDLKKQAQGTSETLKTNTQRIAELSRAINSGTGNTKQFTAEKNRLIKASQKLGQKHNEELQKLNTLRQTIRNTDGTTGTLANRNQQLAGRIASVNKQLDQQRSALQRTATQQRKLAEAKELYDKRMSTAGKIAGKGAVAMAAGSGMLYAGARVMGEGMEFDTTMSKVQSLTRLDKDSEQLKAIRDQARQLGADTMFSAGEAAQGQAFLAMAGFTPKAILAAMPGLLDTAKAGGLDLARTADISSNILTGMGLDPDQMGDVADRLVGTFTRSNTDIEMLGETLKYVAPVAKSYNQSLETVLAATGKLGDAGIQGGQAGTALRAIFSRLAAPPAAAAAAIEDLGIKTTDAAGNMRSLPDILADVHNATKDLGDAERGGFLKKIAGEEASSALTILAGQAGTGELQNFIKTLKATQGEASKTAKIMGDNLTGDLDELSSAWSDIKIELFDGQNSALRELTQSITQMVNKVGAWMKENPELVAQLAKIAGIVAVVVTVGGALTLMLGSILGPIALLKFSFAVLGIKSMGLVAALTKLKLVFLANPVGIIVLAITALVAAFYHAYQNSEWFREKVGAVWDYIKQAWSGAPAWASGIIKSFIDNGIIGAMYKSISEMFDLDLPDKFTDFAKAIIDGLIKGFAQYFPNATKFISDKFNSMVDGAKKVLGIHSPSRVFAELGVNTLEGYEKGLAAQENETIKRVNDFSKNITTAGAGVTIDGKFTAADFDTSAPVKQLNFQPCAPQQQAGDTITFHITGADPMAIANEVNRILKERDAEKARQGRATLTDRFSF